MLDVHSGTRGALYSLCKLTQTIFMHGSHHLLILGHVVRRPTGSAPLLEAWEALNPKLVLPRRLPALQRLMMQ